MSLPIYPEYKDSKDSLFGSVPSHWFRSALKRAAVYRNGYPFKPEDWEDQGIPIIRIAQLTGDAEPNCYAGELDESYRVKNGDLLFSWSATIDSFIWNSGTAWLNQHIFKVSPTEETITSYLFYLIKFVAPKLADLDAHGSTMRHIKKESLGQLIYLPTLDEQTAIATFLDRETTKIDALISEQEKLLTLLAEKRQATISHAVTKGLNPDAPMKDSGVEWLGEVPAHWVVATMTRIACRVVVGIAEAATHAYSQEGIPILRSTNVRRGKLIGDILYIDSDFAAERGSKLLNAGDLVTVRTGNAGVTAVIPEELDGCQCFTMLVTTLANPNISAYFCYWMNSEAAQRYFSLEGWGTAQINISVPILKELPVPVPPHEEQEAIVSFLDNETSRLDALTAEATSAIDLLKERRTALISAAVTGKIDVRHLANQEAT